MADLTPESVGAMLDAADPHLERCVISAARAPDTDADWWAVAFLARAAPDLARALLAAWDERNSLRTLAACWAAYQAGWHGAERGEGRDSGPAGDGPVATAWLDGWEYWHALDALEAAHAEVARLRSGLRAALDAGDPDGLEAAVRRLLKDTNLFAQRNP